MQLKVKSNELSLQVANKSTEVVCYRCGGNYRTRRLTKAGKQRYFCMDCRRHFVEKVDLEKYRPSYLEIGDDVWDASELGVRVRTYRQETKLIFSYIKQDWLKNAAKKLSDATAKPALRCTTRTSCTNGISTSGNWFKTG